MTACDRPAARLRHRVLLQSRTLVPDGQGGYAESWSDEAAIAAEVLPLRAWERMQAMQLQSRATHKVTIRYRPGLAATQRLVHDGRVLEIAGVLDPENNRRWLRIDAVDSGEYADAGDQFLLQSGAVFLLQTGHPLLLR